MISSRHNMVIGCHLSSAKGFAAMGKDALEIDANTFAFFTRNPRGGRAKAINTEDVHMLQTCLKEEMFGPLVAHAPYTVNPCSSTPRVREFAKLCMEEDLKMMEHLPGNYYNFHPGSHVGQGVDAGIEMIVSLLNQVIWEDCNTTILLESMAGKGSEIGRSFEELARIIDGVKDKDKIGVCLDTCHIFDGGYDIVSEPGVIIEEFQRILGLNRLKAIHVNDSKNVLGSRKDRHARIGEGNIGLEAIGTFIKIVYEKCGPVPCILETPNEDLSGYAEEIALLRSWYSKYGI